MQLCLCKISLLSARIFNKFYIRRALGDDPMMNKAEDASNLSCSDCVHLFTPVQLDLCERTRKDNYLPCMTLGIKRVIRWCQKVFKDGFWNCTNWVGDYVLGKDVYRYGEFQRVKQTCDQLMGDLAIEELKISTPLKIAH